MTHNVRFIAIDDNLLDLLAVSEYAQAFPALKNCGTFSNIGDGLSAFQSIKPDLVFLDVEMPGLTGLELLRRIKTEVPMAVFITSHPEFAIDGFELSALDYILKPLTAERFAGCARRIQEYWEMKQKAVAYEVLFEKEHLTIKEGYTQIRLPQQDVIYLEAMQDYTKVVTEKKKYMVNTPLSGFMEKLPAHLFLRIHRSYAVAVPKIKELRHGEVLCQDVVLPIGKTYRAAVAQVKL